MKQSVGYIRISRKDQSNFSIEGQKTFIDGFCERENIRMLETFVDDGFSAKNFDRPSWQELEAFILKYHKTIDFLIVCKYDRFSRHAAEGLNKIEKLERKYNILILSVFEQIYVDYSSPYFFKQRADMLVTAEFELHVIRERTKFGIHQSAKSGRYPHKAPWGYINRRDADNKPILIIDESKAPVIKYIYESFISGMPRNEILKRAKKMGFTRSGSSALTRILASPAYAGLTKVPSFKNEKEKIIDALHEPMVPKHYYYEAQRLIQGEDHPRVILNPEVPLRGVLHCECGRHLTAGRTKGRNAYYWYYFCKEHRRNNYSAKKIHKKFNEVLKFMSLTDAALKYLRENFEKRFEEKMQEKSKSLRQVNKELAAHRKKMENLEDKYISDSISLDVYERWHKKFEPEYSRLLAKQSKLQESDDDYYKRFSAQLPRLGDIFYIFQTAAMPEKQELVNLWFDRSLVWGRTYFRTNYMMPTFSHNLKKMSSLNLLFLQQLKVISMKNPVSSGNGTSVEPLDELFVILSRISA